MGGRMTPRERVERILLKQGGDRVPFTIYEGLMPRSTVERQLRDKGLCLVAGLGVFKSHIPNVKEHSEGFYVDGVFHERWHWETPFGNLDSLRVPKGFTSWTKEKMFKSKEDYRAVAFLIKDKVYEKMYEDFQKEEERKGSDYICRTGIGYEPMQELIYGIMGVETFCVEWAERQDEVLKLHDLLVEDRRRICRIVAESPALHANYGGNVSPEIIGLERFRKYFVPTYNEAAEIFHKQGKLIGVHLDANNRLLAPEVAKTELDYIEAFTPPPDCDLSVKEALEAWPEKILWINFPSSVHCSGEETIRETTEEILKQAGSGERLIVGVTEDIPADHYRKSMTTISNVLIEKGRLPLSMTEKI